MEKRKLIRKTDLILILILIVFSLLFLLFYNSFYNAENVKAKLIVEGEVIKEISLEKDMSFKLEDNHNIEFEVKDKKIRFLHSDCPDKICINTGFISKGGQTAVCLPNRVSIRIEAIDDKNGIDSIAK